MARDSDGGAAVAKAGAASVLPASAPPNPFRVTAAADLPNPFRAARDAGGGFIPGPATTRRASAPAHSFPMSRPPLPGSGGGGSAAGSAAGTPSAQHSGLLPSSVHAAAPSDGLLAKLQARLTAVRVARSRETSQPGSPRGGAGEMQHPGQGQQHQQQQQQRVGQQAAGRQPSRSGSQLLPQDDPASAPRPSDLATAIRLAAAQRQADRLFGVPIHALPQAAQLQLPLPLQLRGSGDAPMEEADGAAGDGDSSDGDDGRGGPLLLQPPPVQRAGSSLRVHSGSFVISQSTLRRATPPETVHTLLASARHVAKPAAPASAERDGAGSAPQLVSFCLMIDPIDCVSMSRLWN